MIRCKGAFFNSATFGGLPGSGDEGSDYFLQSDDEGMTMHLLFIPLFFTIFFV
jgi:hypothetical protein